MAENARASMAALLLDPPDMLLNPLPDRLPPVEPRHIPECLEEVDRVLQKPQDVCRVEVDPIDLQEVAADLAVVKPCLAEFDEVRHELPFRTPAQRRVPAFAVEEIPVDLQHLRLHPPVKALKTEGGGHCLKKRPVEYLIRDAVAQHPLQLPCGAEPCLGGDHAVIPMAVWITSPSP